ncbi:hypothetical protein RhiirC2_291261 [Rhizophagus irregularis]|uniref:Uncharacterized protein n=1 Tax=Rhizophagus irregularis TaxID=588596 RepID=A0A2N1NKX3_9GLOM|nr:hypothetical protein RhiirC2_291261 [Rhizophagus irregularis]
MHYLDRIMCNIYSLQLISHFHLFPLCAIFFLFYVTLFQFVSKLSIYEFVFFLRGVSRYY